MTAMEERLLLDEEPDDEPTRVALPPTHGQASLLDALREERARLGGDKHLDVIIPGWRGKIGLRLGPIPAKVLHTIVERSNRTKSQEKESEMMADTLIAACQAVVARVSEQDEFEVIEDDEGNPVQVDASLVEMIGLDIPRPSSRAVLYALFANANAPSLALAHVNAEYMQWVRESDIDLDEEFRGE